MLLVLRPESIYNELIATPAREVARARRILERAQQAYRDGQGRDHDVVTAAADLRRWIDLAKRRRRRWHNIRRVLRTGDAHARAIAALRSMATRSGDASAKATRIQAFERAAARAATPLQVAALRDAAALDIAAL